MLARTLTLWFFSVSIATIAPAVPFAAATAPVSAATERPKIVSLMPSLTEDLFAIGAGPQVVGSSQYTDFPSAATHVPQVASFSSVDSERIVRLHPSVVVGIPSQASLVPDLRRAGLDVRLLRDDSYDDLFATLAQLGALSGHVREASELAASLHARTAALVRTVPAGASPRTFVVLGVTPSIFTVGDGSYIARLLALAGARNASGLSDPYGRYSAEALVAQQPDAIVADKQSGLSAVLSQAPWNALRAVREGHVYVLDDADILERPGPRYNQGLAWLIEHLHSPSKSVR